MSRFVPEVTFSKEQVDYHCAILLGETFELLNIFDITGLHQSWWGLLLSCRIADACFAPFANAVAEPYQILVCCAFVALRSLQLLVGQG